jgi:60 kDa SS-A/Ro ribonucleoprotein
VLQQYRRLVTVFSFSFAPNSFSSYIYQEKESAMTYSKLYPSAKVTPQRERTPGRTDEVKNYDGAYVFQANTWDVLTRFLILGSENPTYYIRNEREATRFHADNIIHLIKADGLRVLYTIIEVSKKGRAPKNLPALFAHALCAKHGDDRVKHAAYQLLPAVARTASHLMEWTEYAHNVLGLGGRGFRKAIANWYLGQSEQELTYQLIKYRNRNGWSHLDLLRLAHPNTQKQEDKYFNRLFRWVTGKGDAPNMLSEAYESAKIANEKELARLIRHYDLPREAVPTEMLNSVPVWEALLEDMPITALLRNLNKMTAIGLLSPLSDATRLAISKITDDKALLRGRVHPFNILVTLMTYESGRGLKGNLSWEPVADIVDALNDAFYTAFGAVEPTRQNVMYACDVSGSMNWNTIAGLPMTPRQATGALAMIGLHTEKNAMVTAFSHAMVPVSLSRRMRLDDVLNKINSLPMGATDCSLPMQYALNQKINIDLFVIFTDTITNTGFIKPYQALDAYKQGSGRDAKLVVVAMDGNPFALADPTRNDMLDVVGLDTATPNLITEFARGF